jgi:hypothetical protein
MHRLSGRFPLFTIFGTLSNFAPRSIVYLVSIAFGVLGLVSAACTLDFDNLLTNHLAVELNKPSIHIIHNEDNSGRQAEYDPEAEMKD